MEAMTIFEPAKEGGARPASSVNVIHSLHLNNGTSESGLDRMSLKLPSENLRIIRLSI